MLPQTSILRLFTVPCFSAETETTSYKIPSAASQYSATEQSFLYNMQLNFYQTLRLSCLFKHDPVNDALVLFCVHLVVTFRFGALYSCDSNQRVQRDLMWPCNILAPVQAAQTVSVIQSPPGLWEESCISGLSTED